jgi:hypothetical protein
MPETALAEILPAAERTRTLDITERIVAQGENGPEESEKQSKVFVRPLPFRRWLSAMTYVGQILKHFPEDGIDFDDAAKLAVTVVYLLGESQIELVALACLATDKEPDFFDRIDPDDGVKIVMAVVEVNKDFFVTKVLPLLNEHLPTVKETLGQTQ